MDQETDDPRAAELEGLKAHVARLEQRMSVLAHVERRLRSEAHRIDYLLAKSEGVLALLDEFHAARQTPEYQSAFQTQNPLVTVIVPTIGRPDILIERCLKSLIAQSHDNLQIIVVGDHCTDDTEQRVAALADSRIQFHNLPVRGPYPPPSSGRWYVGGINPQNYALTHVQGHFVAHLDDDDQALPERIEVLVAAAQAQKADICYHRWHDQRADGGAWHVVGNGQFQLGQVTTGSVFYHCWLARIRCDLMAYQLQEPSDWNRLRKMRMLRPRLHFVDRPLIRKFQAPPAPFVRQPGEEFLS
jgi:glycosyltransferase involved in cell wall biosynthesis